MDIIEEERIVITAMRELREAARLLCAAHGQGHDDKDHWANSDAMYYAVESDAALLNGRGLPSTIDVEHADTIAGIVRTWHDMDALHSKLYYAIIDGGYTQ